MLMMFNVLMRSQSSHMLIKQKVDDDVDDVPEDNIGSRNGDEIKATNDVDVERKFMECNNDCNFTMQFYDMIFTLQKSYHNSYCLVKNYDANVAL